MNMHIIIKLVHELGVMAHKRLYPNYHYSNIGWELLGIDWVMDFMIISFDLMIIN